MASEFVNVYIQKLKFNMDEFLAKSLIFESQLEIAQEKVQEQQREIEELKAKIEALAAKINKKEKKTEENTF